MSIIHKPDDPRRTDSPSYAHGTRLETARQRLWSEARDLSARLDASNAVVESNRIEIARLRAFVRSARAIVQAYASKFPKHVWQGHEQDPLGAHAWLNAEAAEIGTMRDGGDPKAERT